MRPIDEKKLIKKAAAGDAQAFETLMQTYEAPIYRLCFRMTGNAEDAADMTQEAFLKAWCNLPSFRFDAAFSTWLYRLASNACLDFLRSAKRRPHISLIRETEDGEEQMAETPDPAPSPEEQVLAREQQEMVSRAMEELEPEQRQILTLRVVNDLSYSEIGKILYLKEGTVKSRLSRAREALREKLRLRGNKAGTASSNTVKGGGRNEL